MPQLREKMAESLSSVLPITAIVLLLSITIAPVGSGVLVLFLFGSLLLIFGMSLFTLGAGMSMQPMGEGIGVQISKSRKLLLPVIICFALGVIITIAEPDLTVLAEQIPSIPNMVLILAVAIGVGLFLVVSLLRTALGIPLSRLLLIFYLVVFVLAAFAPADFIPAAFDSGGVTTGPMTTTFLLPFAVGACEAVGGNLLTDAFGIVAMVAMTPLITIQVIGLYAQMKHRAQRRRRADQLSRIDDVILYYDRNGG